MYLKIYIYPILVTALSGGMLLVINDNKNAFQVKCHVMLKLITHKQKKDCI